MQNKKEITIIGTRVLNNFVSAEVLLFMDYSKRETTVQTLTSTALTAFVEQTTITVCKRMKRLLSRAAEFNFIVSEAGLITLSRESHIRPIIQLLKKEHFLPFWKNYIEYMDITKDTTQDIKAKMIKCAVKDYLLKNPEAKAVKSAKAGSKRKMNRKRKMKRKGNELKTTV